MKEHGNKGNQNAKKEKSLNDQVVVRCDAEVKESWKRKAEKAGLTLSQWVKAKLK